MDGQVESCTLLVPVIVILETLANKDSAYARQRVQHSLDEGSTSDFTEVRQGDAQALLPVWDEVCGPFVSYYFRAFRTRGLNVLAKARAYRVFVGTFVPFVRMTYGA